EAVDAAWVKHQDFDELMLLIRSECELPHPDEERFTRVFKRYTEVFQQLRDKVSARPDTPEREALQRAAEQAERDFGSWRAAALEANKHANSDPDKAQKLFEQGLTEFPDSGELCRAYGLFLSNVREDI